MANPVQSLTFALSSVQVQDLIKSTKDGDQFVITLCVCSDSSVCIDLYATDKSDGVPNAGVTVTAIPTPPGAPGGGAGGN